MRYLYILPIEGHWDLKEPGIHKVLKSFPSEPEARAYCKKLLKEDKVVIQEQDIKGTWTELGRSV